VLKLENAALIKLLAEFGRMALRTEDLGLLLQLRREIAVERQDLGRELRDRELRVLRRNRRRLGVDGLGLARMLHEPPLGLTQSIHEVRDCGGLATSSAPFTRRSRSSSPLSRGPSPGARPASSPCSLSRPRARC